MSGLADGASDAGEEPRVAVVTGASAGIGRAIAQALGALGWPVALGARRVDQL
ncbi:MAG: short chain dehydrogenase, partial [Actinomycetota bacterium]|nr:short chain dehydrogenase [Actinomycetota bacterium]